MTRFRSLAPVVAAAAVMAAVWVTNASAVPFVGAGSRSPASRVPPALRRVPQAHGKPRAGKPNPDLGAFGTIGYLLLGFLVLSLLGFVVSATWSNRRGPRLSPVEAPGDAVGLDAMCVPAALVTSTEQQLEALRSGTPRNAIVTCWWELERVCAHAGFPRAAAETSTEFTTRVLGHYLVEPSAVEALAALYREARFSVHVMTERDRHRAVAALAEVLAGLRRHPVGTATAAAIS